jgi:pimeloyl-ACP methyl ester carboxylesterase
MGRDGARGRAALTGVAALVLALLGAPAGAAVGPTDPAGDRLALERCSTRSARLPAWARRLPASAREQVLEYRYDRSLCGRLAVPLDRAGVHAGGIRLRVRVLPPRQGPARETVVALAGGPGQAAFPLLRPMASRLGPRVLAHRRLVTFDQRGTGQSGPLRCPGIDRVEERRRLASAVGACARRIGPRRVHYTTADSVEDLEAVRRALGVPRIVLYGTSYGTKVALDYAARHPQHVSRLLLDSVTPPTRDPFERATLAAVPRVLRAICARGRCPFTRDPAGDLTKLTARLERAPLQGRWIDSHGRAHRVAVRATQLFALLLDTDTNPLVRARFPAAVRSAVTGDATPLIALLRSGVREDGDDGVNVALYVATRCEDGDVPWPDGTPIAQRAAATEAALAALAPGSLAPFHPATLRATGLLDICRAWPESPIRQPSVPLPDVPVLILSGDEDLRTPRSEALALAARLPRARLLTVPTAGHSALGADETSCAARAVEAFLAARPVRDCRAPRERIFPPEPLAPTALAAVRPAAGLPPRVGRTLEAVRLTWKAFDDASNIAFLRGLAGYDPSFGGLRAGSVRADDDGLHLRGYSFVPGVTLTGGYLFDRERDTMRIGGRAAVPGRVTIGPSWISGTIGRRHVRVPVDAVAARRRLGAAAVAAATAPPPPPMSVR